MKKRTRDGLAVELEDGDLPAAAYTHRLPVGQAQRGGRGGKVRLRVRAEAVEILGRHGRLLSGSKSAYCHAHPEHEVLFNACLFSPDGEQIWFGDLDLTLEAEKLVELAQRMGPVYLTPEHPYRWDGLGEDPGNDPRVHLFAPARRRSSEAGPGR